MAFYSEFYSVKEFKINDVITLVAINGEYFNHSGTNGGCIILPKKYRSPINTALHQLHHNYPGYYDKIKYNKEFDELRITTPVNASSPFTMYFVVINLDILHDVPLEELDE